MTSGLLLILTIVRRSFLAGALLPRDFRHLLHGPFGGETLADLWPPCARIRASVRFGVGGLGETDMTERREGQFVTVLATQPIKAPKPGRDHSL